MERRRKKPATGPTTIAMARASSPLPWRQSSRAWRPRRRRHSIRRRRPPPPPEQPEPEQVQSPSPPGKAQPDQTWGGEKGRSHWHKKATERVVEEPRPLRAEFLPTSSVWKSHPPLMRGWLLSMEVYSLANPIFQSRIAPLPPAGQGPGHAGLPGQCGGESRPLRGKTSGGVFAHSGAMISDAVHSASDVFSTLIVMIGIQISSKQADAQHRYGHERF